MPRRDFYLDKKGLRETSGLRRGCTHESTVGR